MSLTAETAPHGPPLLQRAPLALAAAGLGALALLALDAQGMRGLWAALLGAGAGIALHRAAFGFSAGWRRMAVERRGAGLRAQFALIALVCCVSFPLMEWGAQIGLPARGVILPMGLASAIGAAMFGAGMQLGGGCASGTLYTVGGGSVRMLVTLGFFIFGSVWATAHWDFWSALPRTLSGVSIPQTLGTLPGLVAVLAALGALAWVSARVEIRAHGGLERGRREAGTWAPMVGAAALALVAIGCFALLGRPWGVTAGFALWGAKLAQGLGFAPETWSYWQGWRAGQLAAPLWADGTSVMNIGIALGAMGAAAATGRFLPQAGRSRDSFRPRRLLVAATGGLLMGYGARLAYGCNIGAYLGGLTSGSLHGAWWLIWGALGSWLGIGLRRRAGLG